MNSIEQSSDSWEDFSEEKLSVIQNLIEIHLNEKNTQSNKVEQHINVSNIDTLGQSPVDDTKNTKEIKIIKEVILNDGYYVNILRFLSEYINNFVNSIIGLSISDQTFQINEFVINTHTNFISFLKQKEAIGELNLYEIKLIDYINDNKKEIIYDLKLRINILLYTYEEIASISINNVSNVGTSTNNIVCIDDVKTRDESYRKELGLFSDKKLCNKFLNIFDVRRQENERTKISRKCSNNCKKNYCKKCRYIFGKLEKNSQISQLVKAMNIMIDYSFNYGYIRSRITENISKRKIVVS